MIKKIYILLFMLLCVFCVNAQETLLSDTISQVEVKEQRIKLLYDVEFITRFDNTETHIPNHTDQTLFGTRLAPEVGVQFLDDKNGVHKLIGGAAWWQPIGKSWKDATITPTIYYQYQIKGFSFAMGFIPYRHLHKKLPTYLFSNALAFKTPNIRGALISYESRHGYMEFLCDWRALPTTKQREAFRLIFSGEYQYHWLNVGGIAQMNHLANKAKPEPRDGVCDDMTVQPYITFSLKEYTPLDVLSLQCSYLLSFQRDRDAHEQYLSHGTLINFDIKWRFIEFKDKFYYGTGAIYPLYEKYGRELNQGSSLYSHPLYNETILRAYIVQKDFVNVSFEWQTHYVPHYKLAHKQVLTARLLLSPIMKKLGKL